MTDQIHLVYADVEALAASLATAAEALGALDDRDRYELSPAVLDAHESLANRWDERRDGLVESLSTASSVVGEVAAAFQATDEGLAESAPVIEGEAT